MPLDTPPAPSNNRAEHYWDSHLFPNKRLSLLSRFEKGLGADFARGNPAPLKPAWPFSLPDLAEAGAGLGKAALVRESGTTGHHDRLAYETGGNLPGDRGTIEMRYRPCLWRTGPISCTLFDARDRAHPHGFRIRIQGSAVVVEFSGGERLRGRLQK